MARGPGRDASSLDDHPARDDRALRAVCEDAAMGRWDGPRDLIAATGSDWDRRVFRLQVLARQGVRLRWVETWMAAEPGNPDALAALAHVRSLRVILAGTDSDQASREAAWRTCQEAAAAAPEDPSPWLVMMALVRTLAPDWPAMAGLWEEVRDRDPYNREGYHELLAYLMPRAQGSTTAMFNWAHEQVHQAPRGTPTPVLLLVAQAEYHRHRTAQDPRRFGPTVHPWLDCPDIDRVLERWWHYRAPQPHANFADDANYLAHALCFAGRHEEALDVFEEIGPYATRLPWSYCGDARALFVKHRERAYASTKTSRWRRRS
ncbi:hypothetical protein ACFYUY_38460 [Kitasatospora sp. NPDC004745]|uniref:hypothetical protein n=1 Tax=unclassified Kitasatospora TaxID=2633591 RepID=UPI0033E59119